MVRFITLGSVALTAPDGSRINRAATQPKRLGLLAYLASRRLHRRDTILGIFWPALDHTRGRRALNRAVHYLRALLGTDAIESVGRETLLLSEDLWVDTRVFRACLRRGALEEAVDLYSGEYLEGLYVSGLRDFEEWVDAERRRLRALAEEAAQTLVRRADEAKDRAAAIRWAERCLVISPADERAVHRLVTAKARAGDRVGALRVHAHFCDRLRSEFGIEPSPSLERLAGEVRVLNGLQEE